MKKILGFLSFAIVGLAPVSLIACGSNQSVNTNEKSDYALTTSGYFAEPENANEKSAQPNFTDAQTSGFYKVSTNEGDKYYTSQVEAEKNQGQVSMGVDQKWSGQVITVEGKEYTYLKSFHDDPGLLPTTSNEVQSLIDKYKIKRLWLDGNNDDFINFAFKGEVNSIESDFRTSTPDKAYWLPKDIYNALVTIVKDSSSNNETNSNLATALKQSINFSKTTNQIEIETFVVDKNFYVEIVPYAGQGPKLLDYLRKSDIQKLEEVNTSLGVWIARIKLYVNGPSAEWEHGTSHKSNYNIEGYMLYQINNTFANLGVSNYVSQPNEIYEITYDHDS